jgi:hypothetical protein
VLDRSHDSSAARSSSLITNPEEAMQPRSHLSARQSTNDARH